MLKQSVYSQWLNTTWYKKKNMNTCKFVFSKTATKVYDTNVFAQITATTLTDLYVGLFFRYHANYTLLFVKCCIGSQCYAIMDQGFPIMATLRLQQPEFASQHRQVAKTGNPCHRSRFKNHNALTIQRSK